MRQEKGGVVLYRHKLFAPKAHPGAVRRLGILSRIEQAGAAHIVLLQAPAGHGKSTALQQIKESSEQSDHLTRWLTLDESDNDPQRLFAHLNHLVHSLRELGPLGASDSSFAPLSNARSRHRSDWILDQLCQIDRPVDLFLDEFQTLTNKEILAFFKELFERLTPNLRVFIGSRSLPDVGLARLVVGNLALVLRSDDLRFSQDEVEQFFSASSELGLDPDEVVQVHLRTEGWPAALQLFRLSLANPTVRRSLEDSSARAPRELAEYLAENVLAIQSDRDQEFLLKTSVLTRLSAPLCDAVLGRHDSHDTLLRLEKSGMFLRGIDPDLSWFRYHTLFSSILSDQLVSGSRSTADEIHRRAAYWHLENEQYEDAVFHAAACGEYGIAATALDAWSSGLVAGGYLMTVARWFERLPFSEVVSRPTLAIKVAWALVFLRRWKAGEQLFEYLEMRRGATDSAELVGADIVLAMRAMALDDILNAYRIIERVPLRNQHVHGFAAFELSAASNLRSYLALAAQDFDAVREFLILARVYNEKMEARFSRGYTSAMIGVSLLVQGQLRKSLEHFNLTSDELSSNVDKCFASAALASCHIWALYEAGELDAAESLFDSHRHIITESALPDFLAVAYVTMARLYDARGRPAKADEMLNEAEAISHANDWPRLVRKIGFERVRRLLNAGELASAVAMAKSISAIAGSMPQDWMTFGQDIEGEAYAEIRLAIHLGDVLRASALLDVEFKRQRGRLLRQVKLYLLRASLASRFGDRAGAHRSLRQALRIAEAGRFVRAFLDEGDEVVKLLRDEYQSVVSSGGSPARSDVNREFLETLLRASGTDLRRSALKHIVESLTEREREMLVLLVNGVSNRGIASRLFVTENTVKFHLKNIFSKLSVTSRGQAVATALQSDLLS